MSSRSDVALPLCAAARENGWLGHPIGRFFNRRAHRVAAVLLWHFSLAVVTVPALAQQGGYGGHGDYDHPGGAGGSYGNPGSDGVGFLSFQTQTGGGGGGGGAHAAGGAGGAGGDGSPGGTAGAAGGGNGGDGSTGGFGFSASGGGGGGGGFDGGSAASFANPAATIAGGAGGKGGDGAFNPNGCCSPVRGGGGGGGAGGYGQIVTGATSNSNSGIISGGAGGSGGTGVFGGGGGDGGIGVDFTTPGATLVNTGTITGGHGGAGGAGVQPDYLSGGGSGSPGAGGAGVRGAGLAITLSGSGSITGGLSGDGTTQADAITFTGGSNTLTLVGTSWAISGNIDVQAAGSSLTFNQSSAQTVNNVIAGAGSVIQDGAALTLAGANTYSGGTTLSSGTLTIGNNSALGTGALTMAPGTTLSFANTGNYTIFNDITISGDPIFTPPANTTQTLAGVISDGGTPGVVEMQGPGTLVLSGANTYSGGTTLSSGTLTIGNDSALGSGALTMAAGTTLSFANTGNYTIFNDITISGDPTFTPPANTTQTIMGVISDGGTPGVVEMQGAGTLVLSGANTYSGGTTVSAGTFQVTNNSSVGTGTVTLDGGTFQAGANNLTFSNPFAVNATGGTLDNNGNNLTLSGPIADGAGGPGTALNITGSGTVVFTGTNTYLAPTVICCGILQLGSGGTTGSIQGDVADGGTLIFNRSNSYTYGGVISDNASDAGQVVQAGTGTTILTGTNTYTGATSVNAGTLEVDGSIALSNVTSVNNGGTLIGTGTVGNTQINSGGTFAPGAAGTPGTSTRVSGTLALQSGATYLVQIDPAAASFANVSGTASLAGNVLAAFAAGSYRTKQYTILESAGLGGTQFTAFGTTNLPAGFAARLSYSITDVFLTLAAILGYSGGLSGNQQNVANDLNNFFNSGGTLPPNFLTIFGLSGGNLAQALSQLSGEAAADGELGSFQMMTQFLGLMLDPTVEGRGGGPGAIGFAPERQASLPPDAALAYASALKAPLKQSFEQRWSVWGAGFGGGNRVEGDATAGSNTATARTYGFATGADYRVKPDTLLGFALAGGGTRWDLAQGLGGGKSDAFQAGVYGMTRSGPAYLSGALAFANHWMKTDRDAFGGDHLTASFNAQSYAGRVEGGYRYALLPALGVTPYAAFQAQSLRTPSYSETDLTGGGFALSYNGITATDKRTELGARVDNGTILNSIPLELRARAAWAHDWVSDRSLTAAFQALPGSSFTVNGAAPPRNSVLTSAGAELHLAANWSLAGNFDGEFASHSQSYAGRGTVRYTW